MHDYLPKWFSMHVHVYLSMRKAMEKGQPEQSNMNYIESCLVVIAVCMLLCAKYGLFFILPAMMLLKC